MLYRTASEAHAATAVPGDLEATGFEYRIAGNPSNPALINFPAVTAIADLASSNLVVCRCNPGLRDHFGS
jgi:hypothetical protein